MTIRIVNLDPNAKIATGNTVRVYTEDNAEIKNVTEIDVRYRVDEVVIAKISVCVNQEEILANPILSLNSLKEAAFYYGLELVPAVETNIEKVFCGLQNAAKLTEAFRI